MSAVNKVTVRRSEAIVEDCIQCVAPTRYSMGGVVALAIAFHPRRVSVLIVNGAHAFAEDLTWCRAALSGGLEPWLGDTLYPMCEAVRNFLESVAGESLRLTGRNHVTAFVDANTVVAPTVEFLGRVTLSIAERGV
jgi:hypothetical protein